MWGEHLMTCLVWRLAVLLADDETQELSFQKISALTVGISLPDFLKVLEKTKLNLRPSFPGPRRAPLAAQMIAMGRLENQHISQLPPIRTPLDCMQFDARSVGNGVSGMECNVEGSHHPS